MSEYIKGEWPKSESRVSKMEHRMRAAHISDRAAGFGLLVLPVGIGILMFLGVYR